MKVMISQPMRDKTEEQIREERKKLVDRLQQQGHYVVDTVFDQSKKGENECLWYLAKCIDAMSNVDAVVFMNGWENARGCRIEEQCAKEYGKYIMYL